MTDASGAVLPGVTINVTNTDTGDLRVVVTTETGVYRAPLLQLGAYRVSAELQGFRTDEQTGIMLSAWQMPVIAAEPAARARSSRGYDLSRPPAASIAVG